MTDITMAAAPPRPPTVIQAIWLGDRRFDAQRPGGTAMRIDGSGETAPTPPDALLSALATCSAVDVIDILAKRRTPVEKLSIEVQGERREEHPRRFVRLFLTYDLSGPGIE